MAGWPLINLSATILELSCVSPEVLKTTYFVLMHSQLMRGTYLWGNSGFLLQKRAVIIYLYLSIPAGNSWKQYITYSTIHNNYKRDVNNFYVRFIYLLFIVLFFVSLHVCLVLVDTLTCFSFSLLSIFWLVWRFYKSSAPINLNWFVSCIFKFEYSLSQTN